MLNDANALLIEITKEKEESIVFCCLFVKRCVEKQVTRLQYSSDVIFNIYDALFIMLK